jgi:hypothetical protein
MICQLYSSNTITDELEFSPIPVTNPMVQEFTEKTDDKGVCHKIEALKFGSLRLFLHTKKGNKFVGHQEDSGSEIDPNELLVDDSGDEMDKITEEFEQKVEVKEEITPFHEGEHGRKFNNPKMHALINTFWCKNTLEMLSNEAQIENWGLNLYYLKGHLDHTFRRLYFEEKVYGYWSTTKLMKDDKHPDILIWNTGLISDYLSPIWGILFHSRLCRPLDPKKDTSLASEYQQMRFILKYKDASALKFFFASVTTKCEISVTPSDFKTLVNELQVCQFYKDAKRETVAFCLKSSLTSRSTRNISSLKTRRRDYHRCTELCITMNSQRNV